jgi:hypothetical protein
MITSITPQLQPGAIVVAAPYAPAGQVISGTSTTALSIPLAPPFPVYIWEIVEANIGFRIGMRVRAAATDISAGVTTWIEGIVTAWDETNLTVQIDLVSGLGLHNTWNINVTGQPGLKGDKGDPGATGATGPAWGTEGTGTSIDSPVFTGQPTSTFTPGQGTPHANDATLATTQFVTTSVQFSLNNTILLGNPTAPTPPVGDNDTSIATTAFVATSFAPISNPVFLGDPKAPTPATGDNDTSIATTQFVARDFAPINSPVFLGDARAVTPIASDNDTSIATTAFVHAAVAPLAPLNAPAFSGQPTAITPAAGSNDTSIATTAFIFRALLPMAPLAAPSFTTVGATYPTSPTPPNASYDSSIATTAFVKTATTGLAPLDSPTFINNPTAKTQQPGTFDSTLATTAYVMTLAAGFQPLSAELTSLAGVSSLGAFYYRSAVGNWLPVEMGAGMTFDSGILASTATGGGTGGIDEAPSTGTYFARRNATWVPTAIQTDAPSDGVNYVRLNAGWTNISGALSAYATLLSPSFTGTPRSITFAKTVNDTSIATTAFVHSVTNDYATLAGPGPAFTGAPSAPTPGPSSNDGTLATTQFVKSLTSSLAPILNPVFTGDAQCVTPLAGDNDTSIATTQFVQSAIALGNAQLLVGQPTGPPAPKAVGGDVTMDDTGAFTVGANKITYAKMQAATATSRVLGRISAGAGNLEELTAANLVTIINGNVSILQAPGAWKNFYTDGSGILIPIGVGAAGTSYVGNGAAAAPSWMAWATAAQYAGNSANAVLSTNGVWAAAALQTLTDAATVTPDFSTGFDFIWTIAATGRTLANATNPKVGQKGIIYLVQDATGSRTITTWGTNYKFSGGTKPTLTTAANAVDVISYVVKSATEIECFFSANMS